VSFSASPASPCETVSPHFRAELTSLA
jgi:hypothetical protein